MNNDGEKTERPWGKISDRNSSQQTVADNMSDNPRQLNLEEYSLTTTGVWRVILQSMDVLVN